MAVTFGFYNSVDGDRKYDAEQMSMIFDGIINDGVYMNIGNTFLTRPAPTGKNVIVGSGRAWFNHTWTYNDGDVNIALDPADILFPRWDAIIIEVNVLEGVRANRITVVKGTPSSDPQRPVLTPDGTGGNRVYQHPIAFVYVSNASPDLVSGDIYIRVGSSDCPFVTSPLGTINISTFLDPWLAEFEAWFDVMKDQLSTDAAGNLQLQIDKAGKLIARQGGDPVDWNMTGTTTYIPEGPTGRQKGNAIVTGGQGQVSVTFPVPFSAKPIVNITPDGASPGVWVTGQVVECTRFGFVATIIKHLTVAPYHALANNVTSVNWEAEGPL